MDEDIGLFIMKVAFISFLFFMALPVVLAVLSGLGIVLSGYVFLSWLRRFMIGV